MNQVGRPERGPKPPIVPDTTQERIIIVKCPVHGFHELSATEYIRQLEAANLRWLCPVDDHHCVAQWVGIWHKCPAPDCDGWINEDTDVCDTCGEWGSDLWAALSV